MRKFLLLAVAALMAGQIFAQEIPGAAEKNAGNAAWKSKNYAEAYAKWDSYLKQNNYNDEACCFNAATAATKAKKYNEAIAYYDRAIASKYKMASSYAGKASVYKAQGNDAQYIATIQAGMKAVPNNADLEKKYAIYYMQAGQTAQKAGKLQAAEDAYNAVVAMTNRGYKSQGLTMMAQMHFNNGAKLQETAVASIADKEKYEAGKKQALEAYNDALDCCMEAKVASPTNTDAASLMKQVNDAIANLSK